MNSCVKDLTDWILWQHIRANAPHPPRFTQHHSDHSLPIYYDFEGLVVVANVSLVHIHHPNHSAILRYRRVRFVRSMPYAGGNLESADQAHWAECARMGAEERVGAQQWPAGSASSLWDTLLVYGGEERECLVW